MRVCCRAVVEGLYSSFSLQQSLQQNVYLDISRCVLTTGKRPPNTSHVFPIPYSSHGKSWGCPTSTIGSIWACSERFRRPAHGQPWAFGCRTSTAISTAKRHAKRLLPKSPLSLPLERPKRLLRAHPLERLNRHLERQKRCREARGQSRAERRSLGSAHRRSRAADDRRRAHRTHRGTAHIWGSSSRPTRHVSSGDKRAGHTGCW